MSLPAKILKKITLFEGDRVLWMILFFLCAISLIEVYSASSNMSYKSGEFWRPATQHMLFILVGVATTVCIHKIPCRFFKLIPLTLPIVILLLLVTFFTEKVNNASRWLEYGGVTFQPSELAKGVLITTVAMVLSSMKEEAHSQKQTFKIILILSVVICGFIVPENFSTAAMTFLVVLIMMFVGGIPWKYLGSLIGILALAGGLAYAFLTLTPETTIKSLGEKPGLHRLPTWSNRLKNHTEEPEDAKSFDLQKNTQVAHAKIAIATCNIVGKGPGNSVERDFLPQPFSDFIYAIIIEELGLLGGGFVLFLYIVLLFRTARIANKCENNFPALLVMGIAILLVTQALINMAVAVGVFPVTGQPLPFVSKGGTATIINCAYMGIILSVSRSAKKRIETTQNIPEVIEG